MKSLCDLNVGNHAFVYKIMSKDDMRQRFLDIGLIENTPVECVGQSPASDPKAYLIRGAVIAIRNDDAKDILIKEE